MAFIPPVCVLRGHRSPISCVAPADTQFLLSGTSGGEVYLWSLQIRRPLLQLPVDGTHHGSGILQAMFLPHRNSAFCTMGRDGSVRFWTITLTREGRAERDPPLTLLVGTGQAVLAGTEESTAPKVPPPLYEECMLARPTRDMVFRRGDDEITVACVATVWHTSYNFCKVVASSRLLAVPMDNAVTHLFPLPTDGSDVSDKTVAVCTVAPPGETTVGLLMVLTLHDLPNNDTLLCRGFESGHVSVCRLTDTDTTPETVTIKAHTEPMISIAVEQRREGQFVMATGSADDAVYLFAVKLGGERSAPPVLQQLSSIALPKPGAGDLAFRPDGSARVLAIGYWDGKVRLHDAAKTKQLAVLAYHTGSVSAVKYGCARGVPPVLLTAASDVIAVWDVLVQ